MCARCGKMGNAVLPLHDPVDGALRQWVPSLAGRAGPGGSERRLLSEIHSPGFQEHAARWRFEDSLPRLWSEGGRRHGNPWKARPARGNDVARGALSHTVGPGVNPLLCPGSLSRTLFGRIDFGGMDCGIPSAGLCEGEGIRDSPTFENPVRLSRVLGWLSGELRGGWSMHPVTAWCRAGGIDAVSPVMLTRSGRAVALRVLPRSQSRGCNDRVVNDLEWRPAVCAG